jgi:hypothetical protein
MGRGRAKAKQTKVARELKYSTGSLDPERLRAELAGQPVSPSTSALEDDDEDDEYADPYAVDDEDDEDAPAR